MIDVAFLISILISFKLFKLFKLFTMTRDAISGVRIEYLLLACGTPLIGMLVRTAISAFASLGV